ncbi:LOW QUALITY PROTEIN: ethylene-responsive transcription factor ERF026-like [Asparagus officinalis]|uniref:LOW QUALITY PROTEIN: ethylene-responsive transcription factor ERF026-like n=1 Tax=Asparagus officinalis TaxID=4686 RepID=UPI00098E51D1|nr:LOW QUALITY PROTEIN: ethylene-responsive transcription factor ERF026-like [Asparagus officinalis]
MAAAAHDVAAFWLKGQDAPPQLPRVDGRLPTPLSSDRPTFGRRRWRPRWRSSSGIRRTSVKPSLKRAGSGLGSGSGFDAGFGFSGDEWGLDLDSPEMWRELAEAMLIAPPQILSCEVSDVEVFEQGSLWDPLL